MHPSEIRHRGVLSRINDAAADLSGACEIGVKLVAVTHPNGPLKREQLFGKATQNL